MTSEWDGTSWAGSAVSEPMKALSGTVVRLPELKAVTGGAYLNSLLVGQPLDSWMHGDPQQRMAQYLRAYKVGWFYKAGRKIAESIGSLDWTISDGDSEAGRTETVIDRPDLDIPFDNLTPIEQLIRLLERPNPYQTGRMLLTKTQIRRDFAGTAMWYLEGVEGPDDLPTAMYGVSPARLTPIRDQAGILVGWVLDKDRPAGGIPFTADEIVSFPMAGIDDDDECGVGVVEAVIAELPIANLMARHTADLLTTGGRLAGMYTPKNRTLTADEFEDAVRVWRSIASDPNAARRALLFPEPMEYSPGASTPQEIGIPELATLNRDNILTAFPISPYQLGVPMPGGLNSGLTRQEDRRDFWQGTIHPRVEALTEVIQVKLLSRYERFMGQTFDFDFDEPNLDDAPRLIEKVGAYKGLVSIGLDPKEALAAVELDHIKWNGLPALLDPANQQALAQAAAKPDQGVTATAGDTNARDAAQVSVPVAKALKGESVLRDFLEAQRARLVEKVRESLPKTKAHRKANTDWWDQEFEDSALRDALQSLYVSVGRDGLQVVADKVGRVVLSPAVKRIVADLVAYGADRITAINERTRDAVTAQLVEGVRRGYSIDQLVNGYPEHDFPGVAGALLDNGTPAFDPYRAELIARTETTLSFNRASIRGYGEFGVREVQAIDGDGDEQCAERNGRTYSVDDALGIEDHPNGTLDWVPVLDKAQHEPVVVNVQGPQLPAPPMRTIIERDETGRITGTRQEPV